ncbi:MAG: lipocalin family protein [Psychroflexus sp.]|nr:lipocalin family protein [Psychroflexus sp.]
MLKRVIFLSFLVVFSFSFLSCEDEPLPEDFELNEPTDPTDPTDPDDVNEESILGDWLIEGYNVEAVTTFSQNGIEITTTTLSELVESNQVITFTDDNQYTAQGDFEIKITVISEGQVLQESFENINTASSGTWAIDGNTLTFNDDDPDLGESESTIITLNNETLSLELNLTEEDLNIPEGFPADSVTADGQATYTKL